MIFKIRVKKLQIEGGQEGKAGWANGRAGWALPTLKGLIISTAAMALKRNRYLVTPKLEEIGVYLRFKFIYFFQIHSFTYEIYIAVRCIAYLVSAIQGTCFVIRP